MTDDKLEPTSLNKQPELSFDDLFEEDANENGSEGSNIENLHGSHSDNENEVSDVESDNENQNYQTINLQVATPERPSSLPQNIQFPKKITTDSTSQKGIEGTSLFGTSLNHFQRRQMLKTSQEALEKILENEPKQETSLIPVSPLT